MPAQNLCRTDQSGVYLHIYNKGIENRTIFNDINDYKTFLDYLRDYLSPPKNPESARKTFQVHGRTFTGIPHLPKNYFNSVELIAYNLSPNHFHLILCQLTKASAEKFVRSLCTRYSIYFNKKYQHRGSLFAGPYKSTQVNVGPQLNHLTRYLHLGGGYSSYADYLGKKWVSWIKKEVVLDHFDKEKLSYKDFVEQEKFDEGLPLENIILEEKNEHLERSFAKEYSRFEQDYSRNLRLHVFLTVSAIVFVLLAAHGVRNIKDRELRVNEHSARSTANVLSEIQAVKPEISPSIKPEEEHPKTTVSVRIDDEASYVNIRQKPTTSSEKIGEARNGEKFEFISKTSDWFEVKIASDSVGFISASYIEE